MTVCTPSVKTSPELKLLVIPGVASQLSVTTSGAQVTTAVHDTGSVGAEMLAGQLVNTGLVASVTVTVKEQVLWVPLPSSAV